MTSKYPTLNTCFYHLSIGGGLLPPDDLLTSWPYSRCAAVGYISVSVYWEVKRERKMQVLLCFMYHFRLLGSTDWPMPSKPLVTWSVQVSPYWYCVVILPILMIGSDEAKHCNTRNNLHMYLPCIFTLWLPGTVHGQHMPKYWVLCTHQLSESQILTFLKNKNLANVPHLTINTN